MKKKGLKSEPVRIPSRTFADLMKDAEEKAMVSEKAFQKTGLCQGKEETSKDVWEPCTQKADPDDLRHRCKKCQKHLANLLEELKETQGPGDHLMVL